MNVLQRWNIVSLWDKFIIWKYLMLQYQAVAIFLTVVAIFIIGYHFWFTVDLMYITIGIQNVRCIWQQTRSSAYISTVDIAGFPWCCDGFVVEYIELLLTNDQMSYHDISRSREIRFYICLSKHHGNTAAEVPANFNSDNIIFSPNLIA